jgi:hypothetical protein
MSQPGSFMTNHCQGCHSQGGSVHRSNNFDSNVRWVVSESGMLSATHYGKTTHQPQQPFCLQQQQQEQQEQ